MHGLMMHHMYVQQPGPESYQMSVQSSHMSLYRSKSAASDSLAAKNLGKHIAFWFHDKHEPTVVYVCGSFVDVPCGA